MSTRRSTYQRVSRRETHSPRSVLAISLAVVLILAFAWIVTEIVLGLLGRPPLIVSMTDAAAFVTAIPEYPTATVAVVGVVAAAVGLLLVLAAITPGRRAKHLIDTDRSVTVVDNEVIASALARHASLAGGVDPDNARVSVSHRDAVVRLTPASGIPVDRASVADVVRKQLDAIGLRSVVRSRVTVDDDGKVGA